MPLARYLEHGADRLAGTGEEIEESERGLGGGKRRPRKGTGAAEGGSLESGKGS